MHAENDRNFANLREEEGMEFLTIKPSINQLMNFISAKLSVKLSKVLWITLIWVLVAILEVLYIHTLAIDFTPFDPNEQYDFWKLLTVEVSTAFIFGMLIGSLLVFVLRGRFRNHSFLVSVFLNTLIAVLILLVATGIVVLFYESWVNQMPLFSTVSFARISDLFTSLFLIRTIIFWLIVIFLTNLLLDVNEKYGAGVLRQLIIGKYHHPREEERIFMFLDMKGSTTIAERIGHIQFFELLNDFFKDITDPILYAKGSIYQYIGDEVVIVWKVPNGVKNGNCIRCYFNIRAALNQKSEEYMAKYGVIPDFKVGIHYGMVTIGEIGVLKRDIVFSGDVLNTTARMQSMCNDFGVKILISKKLLDIVGIAPNDLETRKIGNISLKGKKKKVVLYTIEEEQTRV